VLARALGAPNWIELVAAALVATSARVLALAFDWRLPAWRAARGGEPPAGSE
jgi:uncharacterized membrane protein YeiH